VLVDLDFCRLDVRVFEDAVQQERWDEAARVWGGDFLNGLDALGGESWKIWLAEERAKLRLSAATVFSTLHASAERRDDRKAAAEWSQKVRCRGLRRGAMTARINAPVRAGRPVDAAVAYEGFLRRLHNESRGARRPRSSR
jgi:hypothetical protein